MRAERLALSQRTIPALDLGQLRPLDIQLEMAVQRRPGRDVGERHRIAKQEGFAFEQPVQFSEMVRAARQRGLDRRPVPPFLRCSINPQNAPLRKSGCNEVCDQSIKLSTRGGVPTP